MANLGNLIVRGVTRILGDAYANKFIGNLQGNADTATSAIKASTADSATSATSANRASIATAIQDYGTSDYREIKIGYNGSGLSSSTITHAVGFTDGGTKIKDISKDEFRNWLATASGMWNISITGNAATATNADTLDGYHAQVGHNKPWGMIPVITDSGYMDVGKHFEFHYDNTTGSDYSTILRCTGNYSNVIDLPSASGTLALVTDNVASATKLQNSRTIWGQSFDGTGNVSGALTGVTNINANGVIYSNKYNSSGNASVAAFIINKGSDYFGIGTSLGGVSNVGFGLTTDTNGTWKKELMTITNYGDVGVGTASPSYKLHVVGDIYTTTGFKKKDSSDSYVLLGGGGHKAISDFAIASHNHSFTLGATTIITEETYSGITGPFNIYTNDSSSNAFTICRYSLGEEVRHWVDDGQYHIDYTNDETSSSIHIRIINTDTESGNKTNTTDYHYYLDCYGIFHSGSNNTGSIGTADYKWANMYATTFHGSLDGNATSATSADYASSAGSVAWANITGKPSSFNPSSHSHPYLPTTQVVQEQNSNDDWIKAHALSTLRGHVYNTHNLEWQYLFGISSGKTYGSILRTSYGNGTPRIQVMGLNNGTWSSWREVAYDDNTVKTDGTGATGTWGINISGNAATASNASAVNGVSFTWDGEITSSKWIAAWESETSIRTMSAYNTFISMCSYLDEGARDVTDGTMFITSSATDNGFADPNYPNKPYKRKASFLWNYINNKCSSIYATQSWVNSNYYTCSESDSKYIQSETDPVWTAAKVNYYTKTECNNKFQPKGTYLTEQNLQGYATQEWVRGEEYLYRSGGTMDARAEIGITTKLFIGNSTSSDTCYTKFNCILHGGGDESNPNWVIRDNGYAEFKSSVSANAFYASSDIRLKNILDDINIDFDKLKLIPKKYYTWKGSDILQLGTIAQDIQKIYPEVVCKNENGYLSVDYSKLSIIALAAIDKLNERIKELECQIKL